MWGYRGLCLGRVIRQSQPLHTVEYGRRTVSANNQGVRTADYSRADVFALRDACVPTHFGEQMMSDTP